jgi:exonuclease III
MSAAAPAPSISFASLNINGLNGTSKRRAFFHAWQQRADRIDVLLLQETHCASDEVECRWVEGGAGPGLPCGGPSAWAHGSAASRGVALLVHPALGLERFDIVHQDPDGRVVGAHLTLGGHSYLVYSVYAPHTANDRASFFSSTLRPVLLDGVGQHPDAYLVVGGDFNCIESPTLDQQGGLPSTHRLQGFVDGLLPIQQELGLVDAYRCLFPSGKAFTYLSTDRSSSARLDRLLIADSLAPHLLQAGVRDGWPGDHRLAFAILTQPDSLPRGPGDWSFPPHLTADPDFITLMRARFTLWFQQHPLSPQLPLLLLLHGRLHSKRCNGTGSLMRPRRRCWLGWRGRRGVKPARLGFTE